MTQQVVYAFEWNDCVYDSDFAVVSLHATKRGAYAEMRKFLLEKWEAESRCWVCQRKPLEFARWRIKIYPVKE